MLDDRHDKEGSDTFARAEAEDVNSMKDYQGFLDSEGSSTLRSMLNIEPCTVVTSELEVEGRLGRVDFLAKPGELVVICGSHLHLDDGPSLLFHLLCGRGTKYYPEKVKGHVTAFGNKEVDLLCTRTPYLWKTTTLYRKMKPLEALHMSMIVNGIQSLKKRKKILEMVRHEFGGFADMSQILSVKMLVGDREVDEGKVCDCVQSCCCQFQREMDTKERRKLELIAAFLCQERPDVFFVNASNSTILYDHDWAHLVSFLQQMASSANPAIMNVEEGNRRCERRKTTMFVLAERLPGALLNRCDKLVLVSKDKTLFVGSPSAHLEQYMSTTMKLEVKWGYNCAEFLLELSESNLEEFHSKFIASNVQQNNVDEIATFEREEAKRTNTDSLISESSPPQQQQSETNDLSRWMNQMFHFFAREHLNYIRTAGLTTFRGLLYIVFAIITVMIGNFVYPKANAGYVIWLLVANFDFTVAASLFGMFALRISAKTMIAEYETGKVFLSAWHVGNFLASALGILYTAIVPALILFYGFRVDLVNDATRAPVGYVLNYWLLLMICESLWTAVAMILPHKRESTVIASFFALAFVLGQGIFTKLADLPANRYILFITLFKPAMNTFFSNHLSQTTDLFSYPQLWEDLMQSEECMLEPGSIRNWTSDEILSCLAVEDQCRGAQQARGSRWTGHDVLVCMGFRPQSGVVMAVISLGTVFIIRILAFAACKFKLRYADKIITIDTS